MVKFRGISVSMISQHGVRKLPEYEPPVPTDPFRIDGPTLRSERDSIASCYVPSFPGSQIWFDYSIENPHPPNAQYFFKLLRNGEVFTSWDCTAKHDYQGRTTYGLKYLGTHPQTGQPIIERQAFRFSTEPAGRVGPFEDCVEVRVHRIEHRARLSLEAANIRTDDMVAGQNIYHDGLQLVNGGILAPNDPKRRYKYQLVDPVDQPYATIRFYYRPRDFLAAAGIIPSPCGHFRQISSVSSSSGTSSRFSSSVSRAPSKASSTRSPSRSDQSSATGSSRPGSPPTDSVVAWLRHHRLTKYTSMLAPLSFDTLMTLSDADLIGLGVAAKGSRGKMLREIEAYKQEHLQPVHKAENDVAPEKEQSPISTAAKQITSSPSTSTTGSKCLKSEYYGYYLGDPAGDAPLHKLTNDRLEDVALPDPPTITLSAPAHKTTFASEAAATSAPSKNSLSAPAGKTVFSAEEIKPVSPPESSKKTALSTQEIEPASSSKSPSKTAFSTEEIKPAPAPKSPKKDHKSLKVKINGAEFELEKDAKRPLSPFTSGGRLRRLLSPRPPPPSAPANITAFGPTIDDEVGEMLTEMESGSKPTIQLKRTNRAERGGGMISRILKKRLGRA